MEEVQLIEVEKDGRKMKVNPNQDGLKELAKFGWKLAADKAAADKAAADKAKFDELAAQCKAKDIKVTAADTIETLTQKLSA